MACDCGKPWEESCGANYIELTSGKKRQRIRHDGDEPCGDCGVKPGGYHHMSCDMERCPACGHQLLSCDCWTHFLCLVPTGKK